MQAPRRYLHQGVRSLATCRLLTPLKTKLTQIPSLSSYPHLTRFVARLFAGCPRFHLRGSMGLAVGLAIKWSAALPSNTVGPSCRRSSYRRSRHQKSSYRGLGPLESDYRESSYYRSRHRRLSYHGSGLLESDYRESSYHRSRHWRSSYRESGPLKSDYCKSSYRRSTHRGSTHRGLSH